jgi:hypothetical protein
MADIKQAAKWMQEGKRVRRPKWPPLYWWLIPKRFPVVQLHSPKGATQDAMMGADELLAEDWEIDEGFE